MFGIITLLQALTMDKQDLKGNSVGEIVNLMSVDCQRIQASFVFSGYIVLVLPILAIGLTQLWLVIGELIKSTSLSF